jgi:hypothetical protein
MPQPVTLTHRRGHDRVVVCRSVEEWRFLPGSPGDGATLTELIRRELLEEAMGLLRG